VPLGEAVDGVTFGHRAFIPGIPVSRRGTIGP
jgi:hypothetical protein